jgi:3-hydroxybutyryl-CoA dehydrogenase
MVAAGLHGRKSGHGYYEYRDGTPHRPEDEDLEVGRGEGLVVIEGSGALAEELRQVAHEAGYEVQGAHDHPERELPSLVVQCDAPAPGERHPHGAPVLIACGSAPLGSYGIDGAAGFHVLGPLAIAKLVELTAAGATSPTAIARAERFFATLGKHTAIVGDCPGLVLGRMVCQVVNECAFALGEGVGTAEDIDAGMKLGLNHPRGPLEWADQIGLDRVLGLIDGLWAHYREERYRAAPLLRELVLAGRLGESSGAGFFEHTG